MLQNVSSETKTRSTPLIGDAINKHHQPKLANKRARDYLNGSPKAEVRGSNPLECAIPQVPRSVDRRSSDCFQRNNVLEQGFDFLWCGQGLRYTFTKETKLFTSHEQSHPIFFIALTSGRLTYHCARDRNQKPLNLLQRCPIGLSEIGTVFG